MANPTVTKTWAYDLNNLALLNTAVGSTEAHFGRRQMMLGFKNALIGLGASPWQVRGSSDAANSSLLAVGAGGPGTDRWIDEDDLLWDTPPAPHSWIVLRQTGVSTTFEMCISCEQSQPTNDGARITLATSQVGFTGGSTTARPTATDQRVIVNQGLWGTGQDGSSATYRWHLMTSSDGEMTRLLIYQLGICTGFWRIEVPKNPVTAWTTPYYAACPGAFNQTENMTTYEYFFDTAQCKSRFGGVDVSIYCSGEGAANEAIGELLNEANVLDGTFIASEMGLTSTSSTFIGRQGEVYDLWWGFTFATGVDDASVGLNTPRYFPEDGSKTFIQVGHMVFPWDGSTVMQTR